MLNYLSISNKVPNFATSFRTNKKGKQNKGHFQPLELSYIITLKATARQLRQNIYLSRVCVRHPNAHNLHETKMLPL